VCAAVKPLDEFVRCVRCKDGYRRVCRECCTADKKARYAANPEKYREAARRQRQANPEAVRERNREWRANNRPGSPAIEKRREAARQKYANDPEYAARMRAQAAARRAKSEQIRLTVEARDKPCVDCGKKYPPEVMELDHVRGTKMFGFGSGVVKHSVEDVEREIAKCEPRCPTCHRLRHHYEREAA
jgi:hypothetical protein